LIRENQADSSRISGPSPRSTRSRLHAPELDVHDPASVPRAASFRALANRLLLIQGVEVFLQRRNDLGLPAPSCAAFRAYGVPQGEIRVGDIDSSILGQSMQCVQGLVNQGELLPGNGPVDCQVRDGNGGRAGCRGAAVLA